MSPRTSRSLLLALGLVLALLAGCSSGSDDRAPGAKVSDDEARVLAQVLYRDRQEGGADFVAVAPYAEGTSTTLTGTVDFERSVGRAQAVTHFGDGRADDTRTVFFTPQDLWFGDLPGLTDAVAAAGKPGITYLERPITSADESPSLVDVLVQVVLNLQARQPDDPRSITSRGYTWQGQTSVDSSIVSVFGLSTPGSTVAVDRNGLLRRYVTRLSGQDFDVTVTLSGHGHKEVTLPGDAQTALISDVPQAAAQLGLS
jgi:hypothetical protein